MLVEVCVSFKAEMSCNVCCETVTKVWNSYGGENICQSCRVFFFRSVQSSAYKTFEKQKCELGCMIQSKNRKSCKTCRFQKCVSIGMKVTYVRSNETQLEKPLEMEFHSDMKNEILMFWDKVWNDPVSNATLMTFASSEKHLMCHFTSPNWSFIRTEDAVEFYQHIDLQQMKSYALSYSQIENLSSHDAFNLFKCNHYRMSMFWRVLILYNVSMK